MYEEAEVSMSGSGYSSVVVVSMGEVLTVSGKKSSGKAFLVLRVY